MREFICFITALTTRMFHEASASAALQTISEYFLQDSDSVPLIFLFEIFHSP